MTLTEFNQNPSRVVRLMEADAGVVVRVTKRGRPLFQVTAIPDDTDVIRALVRGGVAVAPANPARTPIAYDDMGVPPGVDLIDDLARDRTRLG